VHTKIFFFQEATWQILKEAVLRNPTKNLWITSGKICATCQTPHNSVTNVNTTTVTC